MTLIVSRLLTVLVFIVCAASAAEAQIRTFVASTGSDGNACSIAAPCRTLQRGVDAVAIDGDVIVLDSGGFGNHLDITKSVAVIAVPGAQARLALGYGTTGVIVDGANIGVTLIGLGISGNNAVGIEFRRGGSLILRDIDIDLPGIESIGVAHFANGRLTMTNSSLRTSEYCFYVAGEAGAVAKETIVQSSTTNCPHGLYVNAYSNVVAQRMTMSGGPGTTYCDKNVHVSGAGAVLTLDGFVSSHCGNGLFSGSGAVLSVANGVISGNTIAGETFNGCVGKTYGNNIVTGNGSDTLTGFTPATTQ